MGAGKRLARAGAGAAALGAALLVSGCVTMPSPSSSLAPGQTASAAAPTVSPQSAPGLGPMSYGTFPATTDGLHALAVCEQWAVLRDQYVARLRADTPYQLEQWFSGPAWLPAFLANSPLKLETDFSHINAAFCLVSTGAAASVSNAKMLDAACASAD